MEDASLPSNLNSKYHGVSSLSHYAQMGNICQGRKISHLGNFYEFSLRKYFPFRQSFVNNIQEIFWPNVKKMMGALDGLFAPKMSGTAVFYTKNWEKLSPHKIFCHLIEKLCTIWSFWQDIFPVWAIIISHLGNKYQPFPNRKFYHLGNIRSKICPFGQ